MLLTSNAKADVRQRKSSNVLLTSNAKADVRL